MNDHQAQHWRNERSLWMALGLTTFFVIVAVVGSWLCQSLALLSDAAHLFTDAAALIISIVAMRLGRQAADNKRTYGYYRFEILAATFNAVVLFIVAFFIFFEAYQRLWHPHPVAGLGMLAVASCGLITNLISVSLLKDPSKESLNIKSAYIDAQADLLSSIGVIFTGLLIHWTGWQQLDSIMAIVIAVWILPRTWTLLKESINILLEGVPEGIDVSAIHQSLAALQGVLGVHDIHVWALTSKKISLTAHLVVDPEVNQGDLLKASAQCLEEQFQIVHSTLQMEQVPCGHWHD